MTLRKTLRNFKIKPYKKHIIIAFMFYNTNCLIHMVIFILGVMQATTMGGCKLEKRYSPSFREEPQRKMSASKRKRDDILR